jgi:hypothetical protein
MTPRKRKILAGVLAGIAALVAADTGLLVYAFGAEYGPTTGSWVDGALDGLRVGALGLVGAVVLGGGAFVAARAQWVRVGAGAIVLLGLAGVSVAGGQASLVKYDRLAKVPDCAVEQFPVAAPMQRAMDELHHPAPFGAHWNGVMVCGADLLNLTLPEAVDHYRAELATAGWTAERDDTELVAHRAGYTFSVSMICGSVAVQVRPDDAVPPGVC